MKHYLIVQEFINIAPGKRKYGLFLLTCDSCKWDVQLETVFY
jgi:hypothetical protein